MTRFTTINLNFLYQFYKFLNTYTFKHIFMIYFNNMVSIGGLGYRGNFEDENNNETVKETCLSKVVRQWKPNCKCQQRKLHHNVFMVNWI